jgi:ribonucleoside-diphosphate reductase alpha chain
MLLQTRLAQETWESKYRYGDETPLQTFERIAREVASVEREPDKWFPIFLETLVRFNQERQPTGLKSTFGGRITANAGTHYAGTTLMNCFVTGPVSDAEINYERWAISDRSSVRIPINITTEHTPDNLGNIMLTLLEAAETLKSEGGYGINFGFIRPRGSVIKGVGIKHPGVVKYMTMWDTMADVIVMGDNDGYRDTLQNLLQTDAETAQQVGDKVKKMARKGAMMGVLPVWHPDIEEFVRAKQTPGMLTKFNLSVLVDDLFMDCVINDDVYDLQFNGVRYKQVKARDLYDLIMTSTYNRAEPGILFYDTMNRGNPLSYLGEVNATNPCGEVPGNPATTTVCLLGSINLTQYVKEDRSFDWDLYEHDVRVFARMLDNINDLATFSLPQYQWAAENIRQYGMGLNGLGSALYMMGLRYDSTDALDFTERAQVAKENWTWQESAKLAAEKGPFPMFSQRFFETEWYKNAPLWEETRGLMEMYGVRNGKTTTNPPLGNTSVLCDNVSNGIEPVFQHRYLRTYIVPQWPDGLTRDNVKQILDEEQQGGATVWRGEYSGTFYHYEPHNRGLCVVEGVEDYGIAWIREHPDLGYEELINADYLVTTADLTVDDHIEIQAAIQRGCNQSVSKTINVPNDYPFDEFKKLYIDGWKAGLIGLTTYREGSMESVLSRVEEAKFTRGTEIIKRDLKLPETFINGPMRVIKKEGSKFYLHFSYLPEDSEQIFPVAMWVTTNQSGEIRQANGAVKVLIELLRRFDIDEDLIDAQVTKLFGNPGYMRVSKMVSMCLRHNIPLPNIVAALDQVPEVYVTDLLFAIKKFLSEHISDGTLVQGVVCKACGSENVVFQSGCVQCRDCGSAECG